jgi:hypothetical protein
MASNTNSPPSTLTLGRSGDAGSGASPTANVYNLTRFLEQKKYDDGTLHGRVSDYATCTPLQDTHVSTYEARAAVAVAACDAVLGRMMTPFSATRPN